MKNLALHWQILLGMVLGVLVRLIMTQFEDCNEILQYWVKPFISIFINSLKLIAVPLIFVSLIKGVVFKNKRQQLKGIFSVINQCK